MVLLASLCSGMIEHPTHHPKVEVLCPAIGNGRQMFMELLERGHSTGVEQSTQHPKVEGSCPAMGNGKINDYGTVGQSL